MVDGQVGVGLKRPHHRRSLNVCNLLVENNVDRTKHSDIKLTRDLITGQYNASLYETEYNIRKNTCQYHRKQSS